MSNQNLYGEKEMPKKSNGKLIALIIAVVAVLGISVGIFAFAGQNKATFKKLNGTPEEVVMTAMSNTNNKVLSEQESLQEQLGAKILKGIQDKEANELNFNLILQDIEGVENQDIVNAYIKDLGLSGTLQTVKDGSKGTGKLSVTQSGIELLSASLYKEENEVGINIPKILDAPYAVNLDSFVADYENSALFELMGGQKIDEESFKEVEEMINAFSEYLVGAMSLSTNEEFAKQFETLQANLIKDAALTEKDKTTILLANGKEKECRVYAGTLTSGQVIQFFKDEMDILMDLDFVKNYFEVVGEQAGYTIEDLQAELDDLEAMGDSGALEIEFLVDDTYFVGLNLDFINVETNESEGTLTFNYTGDENLTDGIYFELNMLPVGDKEEGANMSLTWKQNLGEKPDTITQDLVGSISDGEEVGNFTYSYAYDTKAAEDNLKVSFGMNFKDDEVTLDYSAAGTKTISSDEVSTHLTKASLSAKADNESFGVNFGLDYGIKAIKASDVVIDKADVKYVFEMTQEEIISAIQKIQTNVQTFAYGLF